MAETEPIREYFGQQSKAKRKISDANCLSRRRVLESPEASLRVVPKYFRQRVSFRRKANLCTELL